MEKKILTGFARVLITPPLDTPIVGYYQERRTKGVLDDLYTSALAISDTKTTALIISVETCELSTEQCNAMRAEISHATDISANAILINCTHTHTGPQVGDACALGTGSSCYEYEVFLTKAMVSAAEEALANLAPSSLSYAAGEAKNISFCRRFKMKNGRVQTNPGVDNREIDYPLGEPNDTVRLLKIEREGDDDVFVVCFGTHADTIGGEYISADWPGFVISTVEAAVENTKCIFLTGSQGDLGHINPFPTQKERRGLNYESFDGVPRGYEHSKHMGRVVAGAVLAVCDKTVDIPADDVKFGIEAIEVPSNKEDCREAEARAILELYNNGRESELPYEAMELTTVVAEANRIVDLLDGPESFPFVLGAIAIGELVFLGIPGELFAEIGRRVERESKFPYTVVCCLTNGGDCYFPTSKAYDEGGYEVRSSKLRRGVEDIVVDGVKRLFSKL